MAKCYWCKEEVPKDKVFIQDYKKRNGEISRRKGHEECYQEFEQRQKRQENNTKYYYELEKVLLKIFKLPALTGTMRKHILSLYKKGFDYDIIYGAVKFAEDAMYKNLDKPWVYHYAILQDKINIAIQKKRAWELKQSQKKYEQENTEEPEIIVKRKERVEQNKLKYDIANL